MDAAGIRISRVAIFCDTRKRYKDFWGLKIE